MIVSVSNKFKVQDLIRIQTQIQLSNGTAYFFSLILKQYPKGCEETSYEPKINTVRYYSTASLLHGKPKQKYKLPRCLLSNFESQSKVQHNHSQQKACMGKEITQDTC